MGWLKDFLKSSIGQKLVMGLTGLFLILFLVVHLIGNLQLLADDGGESFNMYTRFMTTNPFIKTISYGLYFFILLHAVQGVIIALSNRKAKERKYDVSTNTNGSWMSKNMALLGILVFAFLCIHMGDFWFKMKRNLLPMVQYDGMDIAIKDLYYQVKVSFSNIWIVIIYLVGMMALALHLIHGFQSAFTTLGLRHNKYTPIINAIGVIYSILVPLAFALIPVLFYLKNT